MQGNHSKVAVVGAGAVGCYFGGMLARVGADVTLIGRPHHVEAIARDGLFLDTLHFEQRVAVATSPELSAAQGAGIVLFSVKTFDTEDTAKLLAPHLSPGAVVVSLQNGVDNVERMRSVADINAVPAVVYVACAMTAPGRVKHSGRGDLIIGDLLGCGCDLQSVAALFTSAGVPCRVSDNIAGELWTKMIINCAYNAISALGRAQYGRLASNPWTRELMKQVTEEAVGIARAAGIRLPEADMVQAVWTLADTMSQATSSTAQDISRGNRTEIDSLNGYLVRRGAHLGVATPVNQTLHALVKLLEQSSQREAT